MTHEEIDKWVEEHVTAPEDSDTRPAVVEWGKIVAHKFYDLGWDEGIVNCLQIQTGKDLSHLLKDREERL